MPETPTQKPKPRQNAGCSVVIFAAGLAVGLVAIYKLPRVLSWIAALDGLIVIAVAIVAAALIVRTRR